MRKLARLLSLGIGFGFVVVVMSAAHLRPAAASPGTANTVRGTGTANFITKFLDAATIGNSGIYESLGNIGIGTATPQAKLDVLGNIRMQGTGSAMVFPDNSVVHNRAELIGAQGPAGLQGPKGDTGAPGFSETYVTRGGSNGALNNPGQDVLSITVPSGSYLLHFNGYFINADLDPQNVVCVMGYGVALSGVSGGFVVPTSDGAQGMLPLSDAEEFASQRTITVHCNGFNVFLVGGVLTATTVGATHMQ